MTQEMTSKHAPTFQNEKEEKQKFAALLLHNPNNPYEVAQSLYADDIMRSLFVARNWVTDQLVLDTQKTLIEDFGEEHFLPSKADAARTIWDRAQKCNDDSEFAKLMRLYADVCGHIKQNEVNIDARSMTIAPKIMILPAQEHVEESVWEKGLKEQQRKLTIDSTVRSDN